ncbi:MAG: protein disulfide-isomerase precursor [Trizodia sp. TS-e1964]|nr:MAG: protein disulfide-isomerase precursor [Trizodia sp. TS-e1964]
MRSFASLAVGLMGAAALASASDVHVLKTDTFHGFVDEHALVLAEFYAPWCGHCKALAPEYEEAATTLKEKGVKLAKIDCTEEADLCQSFGVEGYPTIKVFRGKDNHTPYAGQRKADAIVSHMIKQSLPAVSILGKDTIEEFKKADKVVIVAYFEADDKATNETYSSVADLLRDSHLFGATNDAALAKEAGIKAPALVLYKNFDEPRTVFDGKFEKEAIEDFIKKASVPLVGEVGPETYAGYMAAGIPLAYIFAETPEERSKFTTALKPIAEKHRGVINFATIDAKAYGAHATNLNLKADIFPAFAIQETVKNQKFPYDQEKAITEKDIGEFVQKFVDGKLEPSIKSEPIPEAQAGPVHVVVAHNYQEIVIDNDKDVLLEYYAPWCGHCKALAPKYEELAALYFNSPENAKKVIIAKVDATLNDVPDEIQGFPTIKLFPAGSKDKPVDYSGSRTIEDIIQFVEDNGTHKVKVTYTPASDGEPESPAADSHAEQPAAATKAAEESKGGVKESVKSVVSEAAEAVKTIVADTDADGQEHDEL